MYHYGRKYNNRWGINMKSKRSFHFRPVWYQVAGPPKQEGLGRYEYHHHCSRATGLGLYRASPSLLVRKAVVCRHEQMRRKCWYCTGGKEDLAVEGVINSSVMFMLISLFNLLMTYRTYPYFIAHRPQVDLRGKVRKIPVPVMLSTGACVPPWVV